MIKRWEILPAGEADAPNKYTVNIEGMEEDVNLLKADFGEKIKDVVALREGNFNLSFSFLSEGDDNRILEKRLSELLVKDVKDDADKDKVKEGPGFNVESSSDEFVRVAMTLPAFKAPVEKTLKKEEYEVSVQSAKPDDKVKAANIPNKLSGTKRNINLAYFFSEEHDSFVKDAHELLKEMLKSQKISCEITNKFSTKYEYNNENFVSDLIKRCKREKIDCLIGIGSDKALKQIFDACNQNNIL